MTDTAPWEWVEGDPGKVAVFRRGAAVALACAGVGTVILAVSALNLAGVASVPSVPSWVEPLWLSPTLVTVFFLSFYQIRNPVVSRLGVSPIGIRLVLPLRRFTVKWSAVRWVGPDFVDVKSRFGSAHIRLTPAQVQRISAFLHMR